MSFPRKDSWFVCLFLCVRVCCFLLLLLLLFFNDIFMSHLAPDMSKIFTYYKTTLQFRTHVNVVLQDHSAVQNSCECPKTGFYLRSEIEKIVHLWQRSSIAG